ncbi:MAG TPA: hypothetical protein VGE27_12870 [Gemmatimonas sp.]|uniref:hypothetical protein n=1 Tax=Gemmatimonas sp. TaxID=1962908 RepID=UPI002EDB4F0A
MQISGYRAAVVNAIAAALMVAVATPARAQIADVTRSPVADITRLTFGYLCDDEFVVRNDGDREVNVELAVEKATDKTRITLAAHEQVSFTSKSKEDIALWVNDKLVAKAEKDKRNCKDIQGNASVAVAPLDVQQDERGGRSRYSNYPYFDPWMFGAYGPWGYGYGGFGTLGYRPFYTGYVGVPIVVSPRGGGRRR